MQSKFLLLTYVLTVSAFFIFNLGCNGNKLSQADFGSLTQVPIINGQCSTTVDTCLFGTFVDAADDLNEFKWTCEGLNGGLSVSCAAPRGAAPPGASNGTGDPENTFYVGLAESANITAHVHATTGFSDTCTISKDTTATTDLECIIEATEGDLYARNTNLEYNVPTNMCAYIEQRPYWFYNYPVGRGPETITARIIDNYNASGDFSGTTITCPDFDGAPDADCIAAEARVTTFNANSATFGCIYDYTNSLFPERPNCCYGTYALRTEFYEDFGAGPIVNPLKPATTRDLSWGKLDKCIGGPGRLWAAKDTSTGLPVPTLTNVGPSGLQSNYLIVAGINVVFGGITMPNLSTGFQVPTNYHVANYFGDAANHAHTGFTIGTATTAPFFIDPIDDISGTTGIFPSQHAYEFRCLNRSFEIKHRIRVYIREWDSFQDFAAYVNGEGAPFAPDRGSDAEPSANCDALPLGQPCNDMFDFDDMLTLSLGIPNYDTADPANRTNYFPKLKY